jgi:hypothetical protein
VDVVTFGPATAAPATRILAVDAIAGEVGMDVGRTEVEERSVDTSAGAIGLPIRYRDCAVGIAVFRAGRAAASDLVAPMGLTPVALRGAALATLNFYDYRATTIGPYGEVALTVLCRPRSAKGVPAPLQLLVSNSRRDIGFAVLDMPVTSSVANAAGREIWGYPKFVTALPMRFGNHEFEGVVDDPDGREICALRGSVARGVRIPLFDLISYSSLGGRRVRTEISTDGRQAACSGRRLRLEVGTSEHPMRGRLEVLGLDGASPMTFISSDVYRVSLPPGVPA